MSELEGALSMGAAAGEVVELRVDERHEPIVTRYAHMQIAHANLARDKAQLHSYVVNVMLQRATPGYVRVDGEHAVAVSWGKVLHDHGDERACDDTCSVWPSSEADATLAMIRVELNVKAVDDA